MKTTMSDIAKEVGVSRATVSRILNGIGKHSEETKIKVLQVARSRRYTPNALARAIKTNKTGNIGVLIYNEQVNEGLSPFYLPIIDAILAEAQKRDFGIIMMAEKDITVPSLEKLIEQRVDGVILISTVGEDIIAKLKHKEMPVVLVNLTTDIEDIPYIIMDEYDGMKKATEYLLRKNHKRIGYLSGPITSRCYINRLAAYIAALDAKGIKANSELMINSEATFNCGYENTKKLLNLEEIPTVIIGSNDMLALGAMRAIYESKLKIPEDIEVMGFDDVEISKYVSPALSTVHVPKYDMGRKSVEIIEDLLYDSSFKERKIIFKTELKIRETC